MTEATTTPSTDHQATVDSYVRFWNADAPAQQGLASVAFTEEVRYYSPVAVMDGPSALMDFRNQFVQHMGGAVFRTRQAPEIHHDRARLMWAIDTPAAQPFAAGTDVLVFGTDGRISTVSTFLDQAPEGFDPQDHV